MRRVMRSRFRCCVIRCEVMILDKKLVGMICMVNGGMVMGRI